jgi:hypothetical protein
MGALVDATEAAITAASHLTDADKGAVEALRVLAVKIDEQESRWEYAMRYAETHEARPPATDNVSLPTYLKYAEALGLTPAGRTKLGEKKPEAAGGKLALLRDQAQTKRKAG